MTARVLKQTTGRAGVEPRLNHSKPMGARAASSMGSGAVAESTPRTLLVSAAVLIDPSSKKVLLAERNKGHLAGTFEFPGGKIEPHESPEEALVRELHEELDITVSTSDLVPVTFASHAYDRFHLLMPLFATTPTG